MTLAINFPTGTADVVDTGGKICHWCQVNDTGGQLPLVSITLAINLPPMLLIMGTLSDYLRLKVNLKEKVYLYVNSTTQ